MEDFRENRSRVLISCRCLDEGIDVPDATIGIVLSGTAVTRQRIQRLGRILRRAEGKDVASLYYLYIQESADDAAFLPGLDGSRSFSLFFRSQDQDFENNLYVYAASELMQKSKNAGYSDAQLTELRHCLMEGLTRADYLLSPELQSLHASSAASRHERNYWRAMRKLGQYFASDASA